MAFRYFRWVSSFFWEEGGTLLCFYQVYSPLKVGAEVLSPKVNAVVPHRPVPHASVEEGNLGHLVDQGGQAVDWADLKGRWKLWKAYGASRLKFDLPCGCFVRQQPRVVLRRCGGPGEEESSWFVLGLVSHCFDSVEMPCPSLCFRRYLVEY